MKLVLLTCLVAVFVAIECNHTFAGTNVLRPLVYHQKVKYSSEMFRKRIENLYYMLPSVPYNAGRTIQGIMAYDLTNTSATANITQGGLGFNYLNLRMKSDRGERLDYDVYVYV